MKKATLLVIVVFGALVVLGAYLVFEYPAVTGSDAQVSVATTSQTSMNAIVTTEPNLEAVIARWYAPLTSFTLGRISLQASIADTEAERAQGLSDTPYIPAGIAKLFIFDTSEQWSFWMKDMQYPIDIFWLDENGHVVQVVENADPASYPETSFTPPVPARYVIETKAGFAAENNIRIGAIAGMTQILRQQR